MLVCICILYFAQELVMIPTSRGTRATSFQRKPDKEEKKKKKNAGQNVRGRTVLPIP